MNMKKVLTVVLAVMLAISAMAVSAFAEDYEIVLRKDGVNTGKANASTVNFTIPVWAQYGYAIDGTKVTLALPANGTYAIVANGVAYALGTTGENTADGTVNNYEVSFGTLAHSWDGTSTVIPQSVVVGDNASLNLVANFPVTWDGNNCTYRVGAVNFNRTTSDATKNGATVYAKAAGPSWSPTPMDVASAVRATVVDGNNGTSISYCFDWAPADGAALMDADSAYGATYTDMKWNATLANKAAILNAETAKVVMKLNKQVVGNIYFGLIATYSNGMNYELGNNFNDLANKDFQMDGVAAYVEIEAPTDTITFEIPTEVLYSTKYGIFNEEMSIVTIETFHKQAWEAIKTIYDGGLKAGTLGDYSWTDNWGTPVISYCGVELNNYWNQWSAESIPAFIGQGGNYVSADVDSVTIVVSYADEEVEEPADEIEVETPVESETEETEDVEVEDTADENPSTGIALAVVPAAIALAVLALKRR